MSNRTGSQKLARKLQQQTGVSYQTCLNLVHAHAGKKLQELVLIATAGKSAGRDLSKEKPDGLS